jgi:DNA modification methylase
METGTAPGRADAPLSEASASTLLLGNCLELLPRLADDSVDCIISDPLYGISYKSLSKSLPKTTIENDGEEAYELLDKALALAVPKLRVNRHVYIFTNWQALAPMAAIVRKHLNLKNVLVWVKNNQTRGDLKGNYGYQYEMVIFAHKGRRHLSGKRDGNVLYFNKVYSNRMRHINEKPIALLEYLIKKSTLPGEMVLDFFAGSGSSCVAAKNLGRNYVGMELDKTWFDVARERLETVC